ncbi:TetR/AcrR family transcriptional regulator [Vibrio hannami]|uniref:TetR/AcrR family transcriptional regulator n=1 Tax=Vibrio hannami TaxID=2717094 RepID=UPI00240F523F|nr:TetR/AcrR family transcriptional regulator [Vibrio hannami]MDG3086518.1 TetR/AcrR family transcriptional regulator [Vibrio hannami]
MSVKDKKRGRPRGSGNQLSSEAIMEIAKDLMKQEGKIPSIRKLAASLDVDAMAIYYYFENKNKLLEAITTSLVKEIYLPQESANWESELQALCASYLKLLSDYPGLLETLLSMKVEGPAGVFAERFMAVIKPLELSDESSTDALHLLVDYLHGFALAMSCNDDKQKLNVGMIEGSLNMYCIAIKNA